MNSLSRDNKAVPRRSFESVKWVAPFPWRTSICLSGQLRSCLASGGGPLKTECVHLEIQTQTGLLFYTVVVFLPGSAWAVTLGCAFPVQPVLQFIWQNGNIDRPFNWTLLKTKKTLPTCKGEWGNSKFATVGNIAWLWMEINEHQREEYHTMSQELIWNQC